MMSAKRIEDLEVRIAFIEKNILDLDEVVRTMADQLEQMQANLASLREAAQDGTLIVRGDPRDERPPHY
jgi:uncharacterized coiled-coil protein SlyX